MYAVQEGIRLAKGDASAKAYLLTLMDQTEAVSGYNVISSNHGASFYNSPPSLCNDR